MKLAYKLNNVCGSVYQQGNLLFTADDSLLSPVGNRIQSINLKENKSKVLDIQTSASIKQSSLYKQLLFCIDDLGRAYLVNIEQNVTIAQMTLGKNAKYAQISPCGKLVACAVGTTVSVYSIPSAFGLFGFVLLKSYTLHYDDITSLNWSPCGDYILSTSKDMSSRMYMVKNLYEKIIDQEVPANTEMEETLEDNKSNFKGAILTGHKDVVIAAYFYNGFIYTVSKDGALLKYDFNGVLNNNNESLSQRAQKNIPIERLYFNYGKVSSVAMSNGVLGVGFNSGMFGIWMIDSTFECVGVLSISQHKIDTVSINNSGEWLAFGSKKLGQLLVWEWQSESYVLKQQVST